MILLFEQINIPSGILYITTDLAKRKKNCSLLGMTTGLLSAGQVGPTLSLSCLRDISTPALGHNLVRRELDCYSSPKDIRLVHDVGDIVLIGTGQ